VNSISYTFLEHNFQESFKMTAVSLSAHSGTYVTRSCSSYNYKRII